VGEKIDKLFGSDRRSAVLQFMWHTSQATLTQYVSQAYGKAVTIIGEHTGDQFMRRVKDERVSE
jgi:hypothetical protein